MSNEVWDYKGMFWDDVNKRFYRWHEFLDYLLLYMVMLSIKLPNGL